MTSFNLRCAKKEDAHFAFLVEEDAMRKYAEETWGSWMPAKEPQNYIQAFEPSNQAIIEVNGQPAGVLSVEKSPTVFFIAKLYLLAGYRNRGLGSTVLSHVLQEASSRGLGVRLNVLVVNKRAQSFYTKHGFSIDSQDGERITMALHTDTRF